MSAELDPQEVLFHLQQLGFRDIDPQQLAEFMRDLSKLMNYDQQKRCVCSCTCRARPSSPVSSDSAYLDTSSSSGSSSTSCKSPLQQQQQHQQENVQAGPRPPRRIRKATITLSDRDENNVDVSSVCNSVTSITIGSLPKGSKAEPKNIKSTFIRPWQVDQGSARRRCDPVALYHQYRALWSKQRFPGEDDHADLRWTIRHRMLGQDPHPRPRGASRATSVESLARRRPRL